MRESAYGASSGTSAAAPTTRWSAIGAAIACALLLAAFAFASWTAALTKSAAADEPTHVVAGWMQLARGDFRVDPDEPPLWKFAAGRPIAGVELPVDKRPDLWSRLLDDASESAAWCRATLYGTEGGAAAADAMLARSRVVMIAIAMLLGALIGWWAWKIAGPMAAIVAVAFFSLDPNFIAHAALLESDVPMSLAMLATVYAAWRVGRRASFLRVLALAILAGLTLSLKFSGPFVLLVVAAVVAARVFVPASWPLLGRMLRPWWGRPVVALSVIVIMLGVAVTALWATYGFRYRPAPDASAMMNMGGIVAEASATEARLASRGNRRLATQPSDEGSLFVKTAAFADARHLLPQAWIYGAIDTYQQSINRFAWMLDQSRRGGWWYYFPFAMVVKTPLATLAALMLIMWAVLAILKRTGTPSEAAIWTTTCLSLPIVLYLLVAMITTCDFGLRQLLPIYPFAFIALGVAMAQWSQRSGAARWLVALLLIGVAAETVRAYPNYVPFFNAGAHALRDGVHLLGESNVDLGQDLPLLAKWQAEHADRKLYVSYFGPADPALYGIKAIDVRKEGLDVRGKVPSEKNAVIAVSATYLQAFVIDPEARPFYAQLRNREPLAILGGSIYLYDLSPAK